LNIEYLRKRISNHSDRERAIIEDWVKKIIPLDEQHLVATCFTQSKDNLLMWGHYADSHKGYCIEYDLNKFTDDHLGWFFPITYVDSFIDFSVYFNRMIELVIDPPNDETAIQTEIIKKLNPYYTILMGLIKSLCWSYENEWRFIQILFDDALPPEISLPVKSVYLGLKIDPLDSELIKSIAIEKDIPVFKMERNTDCYGVHHAPY
ncbi:MAG: DUF2971 domain-containing protein, partial [Planctomycetaceae bacterium]|nr:DUF2971 domain-containing protein [Planctomycetaceae bacterium]